MYSEYRLIIRSRKKGYDSGNGITGFLPAPHTLMHMENSLMPRYLKIPNSSDASSTGLTVDQDILFLWNLVHSILEPIQWDAFRLFQVPLSELVLSAHIHYVHIPALDSLTSFLNAKGCVFTLLLWLHVLVNSGSQE